MNVCVRGVGNAVGLARTVNWPVRPPACQSPLRPLSIIPDVSSEAHRGDELPMYC